MFIEINLKMNFVESYKNTILIYIYKFMKKYLFKGVYEIYFISVKKQSKTKNLKMNFRKISFKY